MCSCCLCRSCGRGCVFGHRKKLTPIGGAESRITSPINLWGFALATPMGPVHPLRFDFEAVPGSDVGPAGLLRDGCQCLDGLVVDDRSQANFQQPRAACSRSCCRSTPPSRRCNAGLGQVAGRPGPWRSGIAEAGVLLARVPFKSPRVKPRPFTHGQGSGGNHDAIPRRRTTVSPGLTHIP